MVELSHLAEDGGSVIGVDIVCVFIYPFVRVNLNSSSLSIQELPPNPRGGVDPIPQGLFKEEGTWVVGQKT